MGKYAEIHCHNDGSNINMIEVVTKTEQYIEKAKELGLSGLIITNHGVLTNWFNVKKAMEKADLKYIHGIEAYVTWSLDNKVRDNFHLSLYAKNHEGFKELNKMVSKSFNREDGHYYYNPRMAWEEIKTTSDNIIISTACLGGLMWKLDVERRNEVIEFLSANKHRCFLEVQPHMHDEQKKLNKRLSALSEKTGIPLIAGGDVHALDYNHDATRKVLQKSKNVCFENEDSFDLTMKSYDERVDMFELQGALTKKEIETALANTVVLIDMVEPFKLDYSKKYPKVTEGDSLETFKQKIKEGIKCRGVHNLPLSDKKVYAQRIQYELETYIANEAIDYMLLEDLVKSYARSRGVRYGYGRGSASGSIVAYLMQITEMNSIDRKLNFERFMSKERISLADIDSDYEVDKRHIVQEFVMNQIPNVYSAPIMTANTMAIKGAIRDVGRGLEMPLDVVDFISKNVEENENEFRNQYPALFKHVDNCIGVITSIGQHACGICVSPVPLDENMGLITTSDSLYPLTMINMKEIDAQNYVKLDLLGLDTVSIISSTCDLAGVDYITPDNIDINDEKVWKSIREDNTNIFQYESDFAKQVLQDLFSDETISKIRAVNPKFSYMDLFSLGNAILRPSGASYRNDVAVGNFYDNGHKALNDFLAPTLGRLVYQEQLIQFLVEFCGYTGGHADLIRRGIGKKSQEIMDEEVPKIKGEFVKTMVNKYGLSTKEAEEIAEPFIIVFVNSANYGFSINHSDAYSYLGYVCGYLRYYYPIEFLTACLNINKSKDEKVNKLIDYAKEKGIEIKSIKFGNSKAEFMFNKEENAIYQGVGSIKFLNQKVGDGLFELKQKLSNGSKSFIDLLISIYDNTTYSAKEYNVVKHCKKCEKLIKGFEFPPSDCEKCKLEMFSEVKPVSIKGIYANSEAGNALILEHDKKRNITVDYDEPIGVNARQMKILISLNYFEDYGGNKKLLHLFEAFDKRYSVGHKLKTKIERYNELKELELNTEDGKLKLLEQALREIEYVGHVVSIREDMDKKKYIITKFIKNKQNVRFFAYQFATGKTYEFKAKNNVYNTLQFGEGDVIEVQRVSIKPKTIKVGLNWVSSPTEKTVWVEQMKCTKNERIRGNYNDKL